MDLESFLDRLEKVRRNGSSYMACCPAHEDRNPSLSVKQTEEGKILAKCHSGCPTTAVVEAMGLKMADLQEEEEASAEKREMQEVAVYEYRDEQNALLYEVVRFEPKTFRPRLPDGSWGLPDSVRRVLYRLPEVLAADSVVICEGEKDADTIRGLGVTSTTGVGGAGKWRPEYSDSLAGKHVLIVADKDEPGRRHAEVVRQALLGVAATVRVVQAKKGKDAADHVAAGYGVKDFVAVRERRIEGVVTAEEMAAHAVTDLDRPEKSGSYYPNPWGFDEPEFVPGRLYTLGAVTAGGKTASAVQIFRFLSEAGVRAVYVTMEMVERDIRNRLLCHHGFKLKELERPWEMAADTKASVRARAGEFSRWNSSVVFSTSADYHYCNDLIEDMDCEFLIFDHLHQVGDVAGGEEKNIAMQIRGFRNLALDWEIPILVLSQFKRPFIAGQTPTLADFKGSSAIEQNSAMCMAMHRGAAGHELHILKNRDGRTGVHYLSFDGARFSFSRPKEEESSAWG